jgi:hypothetical protein
MLAYYVFETLRPNALTTPGASFSARRCRGLVRAVMRTMRDDETPYLIQGAEGLPTAPAIIYLIFNEYVYP